MDKFIEQAFKMYRKGISTKTIAKTMGVKRKQVKQWLNPFRYQEVNKTN